VKKLLLNLYFSAVVSLKKL